MLHGDLAESARTAKIPVIRIVQRTLDGQRSQIEPALCGINISKISWQCRKEVQQVSRLSQVERKSSRADLDLARAVVIQRACEAGKRRKADRSADTHQLSLAVAVHETPLFDRDGIRDRI